MNTLTDIEVYMIARMLGPSTNSSRYNDINASPHVKVSLKDCDNEAYCKFSTELDNRGIDYKTGMKTETQPVLTSILGNT